MKRTLIASLALFLSIPLAGTLAGCQGLGTPGLGTQALGAPCQQHADCQQGLECEVEHGGYYCKEHGGDDHKGNADGGGACMVDADCPQGLECEVEHGVGSCKPHGGGDGGLDDKAGHDGGDDKGGQGGQGGGDGGGGACTVDADCAQGLECEVEHGVGTCKPHGGKGQG